MKTLLIAMLSILILGCASGTRTAAQESDKQQVEMLVANKQFYIENMWALPQRGSRINLISTANFFKMDNDTVEAYLPFYGVRQMGGGYGDSAGIEFKGVPQDLSIERNKKDTGYEIAFTISHNGEGYQVYVTLYDNRNTRITVNSNERDMMQYEGNLEPLPEEKK